MVDQYPFSAVGKKYHKYPYPIKSKGDINVGNDVWIGYEALVLSGVRIGDGAVVGARSVVTKDVPPYAIVAGNPAKLIRYRFSPEVVEQLLDLKWWDKSEEWISQNMVYLLSEDFDDLIATPMPHLIPVACKSKVY
jgi:hypothetical protein